MIKLLFKNVLNMSITGTIAISVVIILRVMLKNRPKIYAYLLWLVVLFRLLCPVSLSTVVSFYNVLNVQSDNMQITYFETNEEGENISQEIFLIPDSQMTEYAIQDSIKQIDFMAVTGYMWIIVGTSLAIKSVYDYQKLKRHLVTGSVNIADDVVINSNINQAFVLGIINPTIYLPKNMADRCYDIVVLHEKCHIKMCHHIAKAVAFAGLCIHWFNPFVWVAFRLLENDMEMCCDEMVLQNVGFDKKADYSQALLSVSGNTKRRSMLQLAFSENEVKERVVNILKFKKPTLTQIIVATISVIAIVVALISNPVNKFYITSIWATVDNSSSANFYVETPKLCKAWIFNDDRCIGNLIKYAEIPDKNGNIIGWANCYKYEPFEGEEDNPSAIYSELSLSSFHIFDVHTENYNVIKTNDYGHTAVTKVYYGDGRENIGILSYNRDAKIFMTMEFDSSKISEKQAEKIAQTIKMKKTVYNTPNQYNDSETEVSNTVLSFKESDLLESNAGYLINREYTGQYKDSKHDGIDYAVPKGTPIRAAGDGVVTKAVSSIAEDDRRNEEIRFGNYVEINHGDYSTIYAHCSDISKNIAVGQTVKKGDVIAFVGNSGNSTGNHLCFMVRQYDGDSYITIDPRTFMTE